jgi:cytochrome bd-type quinol oxidase subunit 1
MGKDIRNAGYVLLAAGGAMILASFAGFVMMESFDKLQVILRDARSYAAVAPGIIMISLGWLIARLGRQLG